MLCFLVGVIFSGYREKSDLTLKNHDVSRETSSKTLEKAENTRQKKPHFRAFSAISGEKLAAKGSETENKSAKTKKTGKIERPIRQNRSKSRVKSSQKQISLNPRFPS